MADTSTSTSTKDQSTQERQEQGFSVPQSQQYPGLDSLFSQITQPGSRSSEQIAQWQRAYFELADHAVGQARRVAEASTLATMRDEIVRDVAYLVLNQIQHQMLASQSKQPQSR